MAYPEEGVLVQEPEMFEIMKTKVTDYQEAGSVVLVLGKPTCYGQSSHLQEWQEVVGPGWSVIYM